MALNPFFLQGSPNEQRLVQELINEQLRIYGVEVIYIPRKFVRRETILREVSSSKFDDNFALEAYISNYEGYSGQGDILTKFGMSLKDDLSLIISKERYEDFIAPFLETENDEEIVLSSRPREGDLIYFPLGQRLFEVKFVEHEQPFYQLGKLYVYELKCELFEYEDEIIDTGIIEVDRSVKDFGYTQTLTMITSDAANAIVSVGLASSLNQKSVYYVDILNGGYGYKSTPTVEIDAPSAGGVQARAIATLRILGNDSTIDQVLITNPGVGYTLAPKIRIISNSGSGFIGTCGIGTGVLAPITIVNSGSQYSIPPQISISTSRAGVNAQAVAVINTLGIVTATRYINAGFGYTVAPSIQIQNSIGVSTGTYAFNEIVTGQNTNTKAYVKDWNSQTRVLKVSIIDGSFAEGEIITGANANYKLYSVERDDLYDAFASNLEIEDEADNILDFSEKNPFGEF